MAGNTPAQALRHHLEPLNAALACVTESRFILGDRRGFATANPHLLTLRGRKTVPLRGNVPLGLAAFHTVRIVADDGYGQRRPYGVVAIEYAYRLSTTEDRDVITFHWTPGANEPGEVTFPHLHLGSAIVAGQTTIRPHDLHKAHVPTGPVSLAAVVRLAVAEFGVAPLRPDWERALRAADEADRDG